MDELRPHDPARIGAWQILARLGAGGMGQVYLGRSPGGRLVAVKVIRDEISDHPESMARFRREAATMEAVRSPYSAQLIEASLDAPPYWLATEYVPGPTLREAVRVSGPFPAESALRLFAALAEGLATVHVHGVTHRDLKPQNVILAPQGPQLIDFGIARGLEWTALTQAGTAPGTPGYAAPEVLMRNEVGPAADVFALGATIAAAATGRPPYGGGDASVVSYRTVHEDIDLTGVRDDLAALIRRCVAKNPAERPALAAVIADCAVDSALTADAHYREVARDTDPVPGRGPVHPSAGAGDPDRPGTTPYAVPDRQPATSVPRRSRRGALVACAVAALLVPVALWQFTDPGDDDSEPGAGPVTGSTVSGTATPRPTAEDTEDSEKDKADEEKPAGPPDHLLNGGVTEERWALSDDSYESSHGIGRCDPTSIAGFGSPNFQSSVSHTTGSGTASMSVRPEGTGSGKRPAPYYVSVGVRPPHETDRTTGRPLSSKSKGIGFTSKPVDLYSRWSKGGSLTFRYPDDFRAHFGSRTVDAIPVSADRGDWTVVIYHVEGGPTEFRTISCSGFHA
ncbi:protein kinase [Streptomyces sp. NBC_01498]|uniref:protein kinase domain-containing protein n=1 Tax=Streptomyces sp. NBC_01498 TaxID=2975870 RepID=UPI002E7BFC67|nr:protein kinase [Streptomyces sp. NBC_01498]WTL24146.1 protein kinase [Streptomyces sp. NBC_01498]